MKNQILLIIALGLLVFGACKKKDASPATPANTTTTGAPPADGSPTNATSYYGIFTTVINNHLDQTPPTSTLAFVWFGSQPYQFAYSPVAVKVNQLRLNGDTMWYYNITNEYNSWYPVNLATETWSVNGANGIPSFSYNVSTTQPSCTNYTSLPDSISKSAGFTVTVNNITNTTFATLDVFDGTGNLSGVYSPTLAAGNNTITVTPSNLSGFVTGNTAAQITIVLSNKKAYTFGGKAFAFDRETQYTKKLKIKS
jgi:hypothetical protein